MRRSMSIALVCFKLLLLALHSAAQVQKFRVGTTVDVNGVGIKESISLLKGYRVRLFVHPRTVLVTVGVCLDLSPAFALAFSPAGLSD
jgi:hypothetical protein